MTRPIRIPSVNWKMKDRVIRHSVYIQGLAKAEQAKLARFLDRRLLPDLRRQVQDALAGSIPGLIPPSAQRLQDLDAAIGGLLRTHLGTAGSDLSKALSKVAINEGKWSSGLLAKAMEPLSVDFITPSPATLQAIVKEGVIGKPMKEWFGGLAKGTQTKLRNQIAAGVALGESTPTIVRRVSKGYAITKRQAQTLVRTSVNHVSNQARMVTMQANTDTIKGWQFVATLDARTTDICMSHDGKFYKLNEGGNQYPPLHHQCRSTAVPVSKSWEELGLKGLKAPPAGFRASMNGQVPANVRYPQWLRAQPKSVRREILGPGRAELFDRGVVTVDKFVDADNKSRTLGQLLKLEKDILAKSPSAQAAIRAAALPTPAPQKFKQGLHPLSSKAFRDEIETWAKTSGATRKQVDEVMEAFEDLTKCSNR